MKNSMLATTVVGLVLLLMDVSEAVDSKDLLLHFSFDEGKGEAGIRHCLKGPIIQKDLDSIVFQKRILTFGTSSVDYMEQVAEILRFAQNDVMLSP